LGCSLAKGHSTQKVLPELFMYRPAGHRAQEARPMPGL
jgi:hypothetical protein